ncbi:MAG: nitrite reductase large subunit NirB, partial [Agrobacterium albertimagni]
MAEKLVIIGNGMAPGRMLEELFERAPGLYDVTIFNAEPRVNYDRIMLSPVLSGEKAYEDIVIHDDAWYAAHGVTLHKGAKVTEIDRQAKTVTSANGITVSYDKLVIATGSLPFIIPVPGHQLPGVLAYRDLDDVEKMLEIAKAKGRAIVIGGGLLGLEAAYGLKRQGMEVTVIHLMPTIMERQLDPAAAYLLEKALAERGIEIITKANTKQILGSDRVEGIELEDGRVISGDMVIMAVGIRPASQLAKDAGLAANRGIVVDDGMMTSDASIYSLGECAEHRGVCYGLVAPLYESARVLADRLIGGNAEYQGSVVNTKLKVTGINLFSAGDFAEAPDREEIVLRDASAGVYKRLVLKDNRIIGAVLYGETSDGSWFFDLLKKQTDISAMRETLIFGQSYQGGSPLDPMAAVAALPDDAEICGCNGVCKGKITGAITGKGLTTLDGVRAHTKASASCGNCTGLVEQLMSLTLGDAYNPAAVTPMCTCTELGHDDVRRLIKAKGLKTIPAVMQELEWKTSCGCAKCRPALNYYLVCDWPDEYADDYQSRFINERVHANIQKDGTYSVVPRMWGGVTNSAELRAIADVVDKFEIPMVKVTGGQRIDLLGIEKEDLPAVWADLGKAGFVSGQAYAKGLRTVKTCVGSDWCRFGTQDSTGLGIRLEKFMWGSWTPAKLKLAVSGCPRNCAEATCKDIGVICVDSGFEIHFAGAAGLDIKGTDILGQVKTEDEALEHIVALTQMYREQGRYLERIYKWAKRIGHDEIRRQIMEDHDKR